jgi:acyl-CoA synthetase (AMP-forming)/AMP-acid ligase II
VAPTPTRDPVGRRFGIAEVHEAIAATRPDAECLVFRDRRLTWADVTDRTRRLANHLLRAGLGCRRERSDLAAHESGQDHLAVYLHNGNEYLESMLGAFKARVAPFNVNYRYVAEELRYLLVDSQATAIVVHSRFAPTLAEVLGDLPGIRAILQVDDGSGHDLLPGAVWYETALAGSSPARPAARWSADDLYILYTGGTTGMPKGVMWRNGDAMVECFGGSKTATSVEEFVAAANTGLRALLAPPFMHGAGHWMSFNTWLGGGTVFVQSAPDRLDPADIWGLVEREQLNFLLIVGDAFARPLIDELDRRPYDASSLTVLLSGGAPLSATLKDELLAHLPTVMIVDGLGSSEAGGQMSHVSTGGGATTGTFELTAGNHVLSEDLDRVLSPGDRELGWLAKSGRLALGYLGDPEKTARTYPVIDGVRYAVPGDRARLRADGVVELHGRDSVTINSGGEKIFAEEVEAAIKAHPGVYDCVVAGRPSERWGKEVVAIVRARDGQPLDESSILTEAERHIARYKLPKAIVFVDEIVRSPAGKADYRWAAQMASMASSARAARGSASDRAAAESRRSAAEPSRGNQSGS